MTRAVSTGPRVISRIGRRAVRVLIAILVLMVLAIVALVTWANIVMQGERRPALLAWRDHRVAITSTDHSIVLTPRSGATGTGLVFIPGAKVDPYAYLYKLSGIVEKGVTVVITKPTLNLALLDQRPLSTFTSDAPEVTRWFVGGHSLAACAPARWPLRPRNRMSQASCSSAVIAPTTSRTPS